MSRIRYSLKRNILLFENWSFAMIYFPIVNSTFAEFCWFWWASTWPSCSTRMSEELRPVEQHFQVLARAKRERVVQDGVEKANRRPTDRPTRHPSLLIWNLTISDEIPYLKMNKFRRKLVKLGRISFLKTDHFRRDFVKIGEIEAHSLFENWPFSTRFREN